MSGDDIIASKAEVKPADKHFPMAANEIGANDPNYDPNAKIQGIPTAKSVDDRHPPEVVAARDRFFPR